MQLSHERPVLTPELTKIRVVLDQEMLDLRDFELLSQHAKNCRFGTVDQLVVATALKSPISFPASCAQTGASINSRATLKASARVASRIARFEEIRAIDSDRSGVCGGRPLLRAEPAFSRKPHEEHSRPHPRVVIHQSVATITSHAFFGMPLSCSPNACTRAELRRVHPGGSFPPGAPVLRRTGDVTRRSTAVSTCDSNTFDLAPAAAKARRATPCWLAGYGLDARLAAIRSAAAASTNREIPWPSSGPPDRGSIVRRYETPAMPFQAAMPT
jgi:hypothetical protein